MTTIEAQVRSALRWYSARWRKRNEEHVVGMFLSRAEDEGWTSLPENERRDVVRHGLMERMRWVLPAALGLALILLFAAWLTLSLADAPAAVVTVIWAWVTPVVLVFACATFAMAATNTCTAREIVAACVGALAALLLSFTWSIGWMRDDAITAGTVVPVHFFWFSAAAFILMFCTASLIALGQLLERVGMPAPLAVICAIFGGLAASGIFAFVALVPYVTAAAGILIFVLAILARRRSGGAQRRAGFVS